jgi:hypothetical protein
MGVSAYSYSEYDADIRMAILNKTCEETLKAEIQIFGPAVLTGKT